MISFLASHYDASITPKTETISKWYDFQSCNYFLFFFAKFSDFPLFSLYVFRICTFVFALSIPFFDPIYDSHTNKKKKFMHIYIIQFALVNHYYHDNISIPHNITLYKKFLLNWTSEDSPISQSRTCKKNQQSKRILIRTTLHAMPSFFVCRINRGRRVKKSLFFFFGKKIDFLTVLWFNLNDIGIQYSIRRS